MGKASVKVFVREGAKVVAGDISGAEQDTAAEVGDGVLPVHCDVTGRGRGGGHDRRRRRRSSAGSTPCSTWPASPTAACSATSTWRMYDKLMDVDLRGVFHGTKHAIRAMAPDRRRLDHQLVVDRRPQRLTRHERLLGRQVGRDRDVEVGRHRVRHAGHPHQRDLPGLHPHRDHGGGRRGLHPRHRRQGGAEPGRSARSRWPRSAPSWPRTGRRSSPAPSSRSTAAGRPSSPDGAQRRGRAAPPVRQPAAASSGPRRPAIGSSTPAARSSRDPRSTTGRR